MIKARPRSRLFCFSGILHPEFVKNHRRELISSGFELFGDLPVRILHAGPVINHSHKKWRHRIACLSWPGHERQVKILHSNCDRYHRYHLGHCVSFSGFGIKIFTAQFINQTLISERIGIRINCAPNTHRQYCWAETLTT